MSNHNSTLIAMQELMKLEAERVQQLADHAQAKADAEQRAHEQTKHKARVRMERARAEQHTREQLEQQQREHQQREDRIRVAEAEARSRAEAETHLRQEQMRLDAQVEMARRKTTPYWLYVTAGLLAVAMLGGGVYFAQARRADAAQTQRIAQTLADRERAFDEIEAKAAQLERDVVANETKQTQLLAALEGAQSERERARLQAELVAQDAKKNALDAKLAATNNRRRPGSGRTTSTPTTGRDNPLVIVSEGGPLR